MARPLRIEYAGALYHVMSRGNERRAIVRDDKDRSRRMYWLRRTVEVYGWRLHSFVLMDNHEHLFVETPEANLAAGMQHLNGSYTSYFNDRHDRVGHLFQGRYKAEVVESEGYFREISRYIHLNPVRAKLVDRPEKWIWSSFGGYCRKSHELEWVTYRRVLREFGRRVEPARREYRRFVSAGVADMPENPLREAVSGVILGSEEFVERIRRMFSEEEIDESIEGAEGLRNRPSLERIIEVVAEDFGEDPNAWGPGRRCDSAARAAVAYLARCKFGYRAKDVARALGYKSHGGAAAAVRRVETGDRSLRRRVDSLGRRLTNV